MKNILPKQIAFIQNKEELFADIIAAYKQVIKEHYDAGCRVIQLDDCTWGAIVEID